MTYFGTDPIEQTRDAIKRLEIAERVLERAETMFAEDESQTNLIALTAALRLVQETSAQAEEWLS